MKLIRLRDVEAKTGLKHSAIYQRITEGEFPRQVPLGPKAVAWLEVEIDEWIRRRVAKRDGTKETPHDETAA